VDGRDEIEVAGIDERGDDRPALGSAVAILHRQRDVADGEVQRVSAQQQEECRHEDQDQQRPPIAGNLSQLLPVDGQRLAAAAVPPEFSTTSRNTSSSDGGTSSIERTVIPCAANFAVNSRMSTRSLRSTA